MSCKAYLPQGHPRVTLIKQQKFRVVITLGLHRRTQDEQADKTDVNVFQSMK